LAAVVGCDPIGAEHIEIGLIDETRIVARSRIDAYREGLRERQVHHALDVFVGRVRVVGFAQSDFPPGVEAAGIGRVQHEADRAPQRSRAIEGTLRAAQHFHAIQILQAHVEKERRIVDIGGHRRHHRGRQSFLERQGLAVQPAHDQVAAVDAVERAFVGEVDSGHRVRETGHILNSGRRERLTAHGGDADGQILRGDRPAARRNDHLLQGGLPARARGRIGRGRRCERGHPI
jgi:hypothetical protein